MKNLEPREGYLNRHINPLPKEKCIIEIINKDVDGEHLYKCEWNPLNPLEYMDSDIKPSPEYVGTARTIESKLQIGFNVWDVNNSEFIYYKLIN